MGKKKKKKDLLDDLADASAEFLANEVMRMAKELPDALFEGKEIPRDEIINERFINESRKSSGSKYNVIRLIGRKVDLCVFRTDKKALKKYVRWVADENVCQWIAANDKVYSWDAEEQWMKEIALKNSWFNIVTKEGKLIGTCSVEQKGISTNWELGICIGEQEYRDKGIGTEVIAMLTKYAFNELNAHRVRLTVNGDNFRAIRCYSKAGFVECGREREAGYYGGGYCDVVIMETLRREWKGIQ